ncbi:MAG: glycoside hydrolase family 108 protein [Caulobacterales bacterium]|uniref:glycoside hydrolase family 108 protein n=1 Tax=Glycocaulis sp. TaxID=1969725 RepID=UPI003FA09A10
MTHTAFETALAHVLAHEGGYVEHADDPGGATNMGITHITLAGWRGQAVTRADVAALTRSEVTAIYKARFWDPCRCEAMPEPVAVMVFDGAVNHGAARAARLLQQALGVAIDGRIGPVTLAAARAAETSSLLTEFAARRMVLYAGLDHFRTFGLGWSRRLMGTLAATLPTSLAAWPSH